MSRTPPTPRGTPMAPYEPAAVEARGGGLGLRRPTSAQGPSRPTSAPAQSPKQQSSPRHSRSRGAGTSRQRNAPFFDTPSLSVRPPVRVAPLTASALGSLEAQQQRRGAAAAAAGEQQHSHGPGQGQGMPPFQGMRRVPSLNEDIFYLNVATPESDQPPHGRDQPPDGRDRPPTHGTAEDDTEVAAGTAHGRAPRAPHELTPPRLGRWASGMAPAGSTAEASSSAQAGGGGSRLSVRPCCRPVEGRVNEQGRSSAIGMLLPGASPSAGGATCYPHLSCSDEAHEAAE